MSASRLIYQNEQWAVTTYGVECVEPGYSYFIEKERLHIPADWVANDVSMWVLHITKKAWVDGDLFCNAFRHALTYHGVGEKLDVEKSIAVARYNGRRFWRVGPSEVRATGGPLFRGGIDATLRRLAESEARNIAEAERRYGPRPAWLAEAAA